MTQTNILFIGMDVHKESIVISLADDDRSEVRRYSTNRVKLTDQEREDLEGLISSGRVAARKITHARYCCMPMRAVRRDTSKMKTLRTYCRLAV